MSQMGGSMILMFIEKMRKIWVVVKIKLLERWEQHWKGSDIFRSFKETKPNLQRNQKTKENEED